MRRSLALRSTGVFFALIVVSFLAACGGGNNSSAPVSQIILSPTSISMNEGDVVTLSATTEDVNGNAVAADISFTSSNANIATVSTGGLICGGAWDANIIVCNAHNGTSGVGQVTITATSGSVTATATVYVHEHLDRMQVNVPTGCVSDGKTVTLTAKGYSTSAPGCSQSAPCDITSTIGPISYGSNDTTIVGPNSDGDMIAGTPGETTVYATASLVNSPSADYVTCRVDSIRLHGSGTGDTSFTMAALGTQLLQADVYDTSGTYINPPLTWSSSLPAVVSIPGTTTSNNQQTMTAVAPGTATITASCAYPYCNKNLARQYTSTVVTANVTGTSATTVYAGSTNSKTLVPINTKYASLGTAITLPYVPSSMMSDSAGTTLYLGSPTALMVVTVSTGAVTTYNVNGVVTAISPDGTFMLLSAPANDAIYYYILAGPALGYKQEGFTTNSATYTPDSWWSVAVSGQTMLSGVPTKSPILTTLPYVANATDVNAQGGLTYITSSAAREIDVYSTCSYSEIQPLTVNAPTLIARIPDGTGAIATDSPNVDVVTTAPYRYGCPVPGQSSVASYSMETGDFNATQLFVSPDSSQAWILSDQPNLYSFHLKTLRPSAIPLVNGAIPLRGGITPDGLQVYLGASDGTVHRVDVLQGTDVQQIAVGLKDSNGNAVAPNLLYMVP